MDLTSRNFSVTVHIYTSEENHRIIKWFGLKETWKIISFEPQHNNQLQSLVALIIGCFSYEINVKQ